MTDYASPLSAGPESFAERVRKLLGLRSGTQKIRYAATITPDALKSENVVVDTLTGNLTIANPVNSREGMWLNFKLTQDGVGARTVAWGNAFKANWSPDTAASKVNTITFRYDGLNWIQMASATGM